MNLILSRFEQTVRAMPDKRAVGYEDTEYTFSALRSLSARLGCALSQRLPRGQAAGVLVRRGIETVAEFFAVVYAGGFYVPLDPDMPEHKLRTILEDAGIAYQKSPLSKQARAIQEKSRLDSSKENRP